MNDDGTVQVGLEPEGGDTIGGDPEYRDDSYLQPADNLDAALAMGKEMLMGDSEQMAEKEGDAAMDRGFMKSAGGME